MDNKSFYRKIILAVLLGALFLPLTGCISALSQASVEANAIQEGSYTVILYRGYGFRDLDSAAFLDIEGDGIHLAENGNESGVGRIEKQDRVHAFEAAEEFLGHHADFNYAQVQALTTADGTLVGYEIRPIFHAFDAGGGDPLEITYTADGNRFLFTVDFRWVQDEPDDRRR